jgi:hypothetical protein
VNLQPTLYHLRYTAEAYDGRFAGIRYPARYGVDHATAENMRAAMPKPELFEIVEEGE